MRNLLSIGAVMFLGLFVPHSQADEFKGIHCGDDIAKKLTGRKSTNERVVVIEKRHKDIGLLDLGAFMGSGEAVTYITWRICDSLYTFLIKGDAIKDVYKHPPKDSGSFDFMGPCRHGSDKSSDYYVGVLNGPKSDSLVSPVQLSLINEAILKFEPQSPANFKCYSADALSMPAKE